MMEYESAFKKIIQQQQQATGNRQAADIPKDNGKSTRTRIEWIFELATRERADREGRLHYKCRR